MSTATICLNEVGNPYSPRKQGAGLASLLNSTSTDAYLYVKGIDKSKLELGDDKEKTGVYECEFNVKNISDKELTYEVSNYTMSETISTDGTIKAVAETAYMFNPLMSVSASSNATLNGTRLTIPANSDVSLKVTLALSQEEKKYLDDNFENGMYVEGFVRLLATKENQVNLSIPFLSYYGDWLQPPMFDKTYYEVEADRANGAISEKDKVKADMYATTPYGKYGDYYMIPLGGYIYDIDPMYNQIAATEEKAAISVDAETAVYQLYTIYVGMLRGAKKLTMTITNENTNEVLYVKETYNNRKSTYFGSAGGVIPYYDDIDFDMFDAETGEVFANNTKISVSLVAELDYENGDKVANNTFDFSFYVDYETPTLENARYITEWDKTDKKYRYYVDLDVSDNRFVQAIRPCAIVNNSLISLVDNPIPVYQANANETTTVRIEITDYFSSLSNSEYKDTIFFLINDYALNSNIFTLALSGCNNTSLAFNGGGSMANPIVIKQNEVINLNDYVNVENATLQGLEWSSSNKKVAIVNNAEVIGLTKGIVTITGISNTYGISIQANIKVVASDSVVDDSLSKVKFAGYESVFTFDDDFENPELTASGEFSYMPDNNTFNIYPSESFKLLVDYEPWYFDSSTIDIVWTSSNTNYVIVDENGVVTALKETISPVSIRASAYNKNGQETLFSASATVVVKDPFIHSGIMLQYYKGFGGEVVIPDDLGIEYIGEYAFSHYLYDGVDDEGLAIRKAIGDNTSTPISKIIIPEGVKYIQSNAFEGLASLTEVVLPSTLRDIYVDAFKGCSSLTKINLNSVVKIENGAFKDCSLLSTINQENATTGNDLSNVVTVGVEAFKNTNISKLDLKRLRMAGKDAFADCLSLTEVTLYDDNPLNVSMFKNSAITSIVIPHAIIPRNAFEGCSNISSVTFTNETVTINTDAFKGCSMLSNIIFNENSDSITIGYNAFEGCNVKTLTLPSCEVIINDEAFKDSKIEKIVLNENTILSLNGVPFSSTAINEICINNESNYYNVVNQMLVNKANDTLIFVPTNVEAIIPLTINTIETAAFSANRVTKSLDITSNVTSIKPFAFAESALESVNFVNTSSLLLGDYAFYGCASLKEVNNLDLLSVIPSYAFASTSLENIVVKENATINYGAFANITTLNSVVFNDNVTIGDYAFYGAFANNATLTIDNASIGEYAFANSNLASVTLSSIANMSNGAFYQSKIETLAITNTQSIANSAFAKCSLLNEVTLENVDTIGNNAFANDSALTKVVGSGVTAILDNAFINNTLLSEIDLSSITEIGAQAFKNNESLTSIDVSSLNTMKEAAFMNCSALVNVNNLENSTLTNIPYMAFAFKDAKENVYASLVTIDLSNVTNIDGYAFYGQNKLENVNLENVIKVDEYAFYGTAINTANLLNCEEVGNYAFYATSLRSIAIPKLVAAGICSFAQTYADALDLPDTLKSIKYGSFSSISRLENFTHNNEVNYIKYDENNKPLWQINDGVLYTYLADGSLQLQSYPVNSPRESYNVLEGTKRIDAYSFYSVLDVKLTEVFLPKSLVFIGDGAFTSPSIKTYHFASYKAPILEGVYNIALQNYIHQLQSTNQTIENLYHINATDYPISNFYYYHYPYYYCNFVDYVGFVSDLTMYYPANGEGYDNYIYKNYFKNKNSEGIVKDEVTSQASDALDKLGDISVATKENRDLIEEVYSAYLLVIDPEQLALLDANKVAQLLDLHQQLIDMDYPVLSQEELSDLVGSYYGVDSEETTYDLTINQDGSGTFTIDNKLNDNLDTVFTFNHVRQNKDQYILIINDSDSFEFYLDEDGNIVLKYYINNVVINKKANNLDNPPATNNALVITLCVVGLVSLLFALSLFVLMLLKKRKMLRK
ncbi:MAG: leucine-rich repeat protein [Erysipelotrichaceae bacterium]|nr:leucine-rich repeat protein [Erysipelotrichaceae bacterium]